MARRNRANRASFYQSMAWKDTRKAYLKSVGGLCEKCLAKGIIKPAEAVHHVTPLTEENVFDLNISLSWDNLQALCRTCHAEEHEEMYQKLSKRRYIIDKNGKVIIKPDFKA